MFSSKSIKFKLASWGIASIVIVSLFLIYSSSSHLYTALYEDVKANSKVQAEASAQEITKRLNKAFSTARNLAHAYKAAKLSDGKLTFTRDQADELLKNSLREDSNLLGVWTLWEPNKFDNKDSEFVNKGHSDATGRYVPYWTMGDNGPQVEALVDYETPGAGDYYQLAKKLKTEVILEPYIYKVNGVDTLITTLTVPIVINGEFYGVTGVDIALDFFQNLASKINIYEGAGKVFVFSHTGIVAAYSKDKKLINKNISKIKLDNYVTVDKKRFTSKSSVKIDDHNVSTIVPIHVGEATTPWYIETLVPTSIIQGEIRSSIFSLVGWGSLITVLLIFSGIYTINKISKKLGNIAEQLQAEADNVLKAANEIDKSSTRLSTATHQQSSSLQETSASINEISAMVVKSSETAASTTSLSSESQVKAEEGKRSVNNVKSKIDEIHKNNSSLVQSVEKNNQDVENIINIIAEIEDKTKVINDIVFQTKLLSFNASVEAARAGEHGKGFSVVAEEVGALAEMSGAAATEISELLERSSAQVKNTVLNSKDSIDKIIKEGNLKVEEGLEEISVCDERLQEIVQSFEVVNHAVKDISVSSSEQSSGVNEITNAINQLNQVTQENTAVAKESQEKALDLKSQSTDLLNIVNEIQSVVFGDKDAA